jgi:hypothetical protein
MVFGVIRDSNIVTIKPALGSKVNWNHPTTNQLKGYWLFNEGGGSQLKDLVGANPMVFSGTAPYFSSGILGGSAGLFNGSNTLALQLTSTNSFHTFGGSVSVAAWFKITGGSGARILFCRYPDTASKGFILLWISGNKLVLDIEDSSGNMCNRASSTTPATNTWYFGVGVFDAVAGTVNIYLNGALNNGTLTGTVISSLGAGTQILAIGNNNGGASVFQGNIDNVMVWNRALNVSEIQLLYRYPFSLVQPSIQYQGSGAGVAPPAQTGFPLFFGSAA